MWPVRLPEASAALKHSMLVGMELHVRARHPLCTPMQPPPTTRQLSRPQLLPSVVHQVACCLDVPCMQLTMGALVNNIYTSGLYTEAGLNAFTAARPDISVKCAAA